MSEKGSTAADHLVRGNLFDDTVVVEDDDVAGSHRSGHPMVISSTARVLSLDPWTGDLLIFIDGLDGLKGVGRGCSAGLPRPFHYSVLVGVFGPMDGF